MKPVIRYQSQLLFRRSYKPTRIIRIRPSPVSSTYAPNSPAAGAGPPAGDGPLTKGDPSTCRESRSLIG